MSRRRVGARSGGNQWRLWLVAVLFFGVGDLASTTAGIAAGGVEANPVVGGVVRRYELAAMVPLKLVIFGLCYLIWRRSPEPYCASVPVALATMGAAATGWNLLVILVVT